ncbi:MAG: CpaF family protein [Candidatus Omnitrophota bacterium]
MVKDYKEKIRRKLIAEYRDALSSETIDPKELERTIQFILDEMVRREGIVLSGEERIKITTDLIHEFVGFGPLESLLKDPEVTEIMVNGANKVYVERSGRTELSKIVFDNERQVMNLIDKILTSTRRHVDETYPYTEVALKDGSRINIIIPPLALDGPTLTIRKFMKEIRTAEDLINLGTLDKRISDFLIACIKAKVNIIFSGATGAGKTTSLNVFSSYIDDEERVITIEDTAELRLDQEHVVRLEAKQSNIEGKGEIGIRELFKNSLRMRPDRIILGEIRGQEVLEMLQSICSGHKGSLSVIHANSPQNVIYRIETMILTSGIPILEHVIHRHIAAAVNLIVQQEQLLDGSRKITHVTQINGLKDGQVVLEDIFLYDSEEADSGIQGQGRWRATGIIPIFTPQFKKAGVDLPKEIFNKD